MHAEPLLPGRPYLMKLGSSTASCSVTHIKHGINVNTLERTPATTLAVNDIAVANIATDRRLPFDPYRANRETGGFVLIDRLSNVTVGAGLIDFALRRSENIHWQALDVTKEARVAIKGHRPGVVWFTGHLRCGQVHHRQRPGAAAARARLPHGDCSTATTSGTGSAATSASPTPTGWRTSGGWARSPS